MLEKNLIVSTGKYNKYVVEKVPAHAFNEHHFLMIHLHMCHDS